MSQQYATSEKPESEELHRHLFDDLARHRPNPVALELAELRREIAALREVIAPASSSILTGKEVADHWKRLNGGAAL